MALSPQLWCVLTSFLLVPGRVVLIDSLIDHLWGGDAPQMARTTIRTYISRINSLLAQHPEARIHRYALGYRLNIDPQTVDLHRFRSLKRQAEAVAESGDLHHAADLLEQAEELWQGPALAGLPGDWAPVSTGASVSREAAAESRE
jgi:DNA-binding SARP family transcriptional activator